MSRPLPIIVALSVLALSTLPSIADDRLDDGVLTVCDDGCEFTSINEAIAMIPENGGITDHYIEIHDAVHREGAEIRSDGKNFGIRKGDSVKGADPVIDGQSLHRIMRVESGSQVGLLDVDFENGVGSTNGGAILVTGGSLLSAARCEFRGNVGDPDVAASRGGAIYINNANALCYFDRCVFDSNVAGRGGAVNANAFMVCDFNKVEFLGNMSDDSSYAHSIVNGHLESIALDEASFCGDGPHVGGYVVFRDGLVTMTDSCETSSGIPGDHDGDGDLDADDLTGIRDALGLCAADIDGDGTVDGADLSYILGFWGICAAP